MPVWDKDALDAPHTQRELGHVEDDGFVTVHSSPVAARDSASSADLDALQREAQIAGLGRPVTDLVYRLNSAITALRADKAAMKAEWAADLVRAGKDRRAAVAAITPQPDAGLDDLQSRLHARAKWLRDQVEPGIVTAEVEFLEASNAAITALRSRPVGEGSA
ncbi:MAG TPA: hypothetical protein PKE59_00075 [Novosphingobium sp.]|jgi:hypothetical protein|nr:hypothetical protein [Novosphingobium sp.]